MRFDRIIPLSKLSAHPKNDYLDFVFFLPKNENKQLRLWLKTGCDNPILKIDDDEFKTVKVYQTNENVWHDLGVTNKLKGHFGQLRVFNMTYDQAQSSYLLITEQTEYVFKDSIKQAEIDLWGITKEDVGSTSLSPATLTCGQPVKFTLTYSPKEKDLPAESKIRLSIPHSMSKPQWDNAKKDGYINIKSSNDTPVHIENLIQSEESHVVYDLTLNLPEGLPKDSIVTVNYRCDITPIFNAYYHDTNRMYWYVRQAPLSVAVKVKSNDNFVEPLFENGHAIKFKPGPAERLFLNLPGRVKARDNIHLKCIFTDKYRNVPPSNYPDTNIKLYLLNNNKETLINKPFEFYNFYSFKVNLGKLNPGLYRIVAKDTKNNVVACSNPMEIMNSDDTRLPVYFGEIHGHCIMSDGSGEYVDMYTHARDTGCLDFAASGDHACYYSDNEWEMMQSITNSFNDPGKFVTLIGYEWAGKQVHRNIYTKNNSLKLFRGMYEPTSSIDTVYEYFKNRDDIVAGPHGSIAHGIKWEYHEPSVERFIEMYSMWGSNDFPDSPLICPRGYRPPRTKTVNDILKTGAVLGFTGGGDCHEGRCGFSCEDPENQGKRAHTFAKGLPYRCGLTGAHAPNLKRDGIIDALRNRKTYATTGAKILLDFTVNNLTMGDIGSIKKPAVLNATVHGCDDISKIRVVKNGDIVYTETPSGKDVKIQWKDDEAIKNKTYYYIQVIQKDNQMAWSGPIYINPS